jgi:hypothetical protein
MKRIALSLGTAGICLCLGLADPGVQQSFESRSPLWQAGSADAPFQELQHEITTRQAHSGQKSEYIRLQAEQGAYVYYYYPVGRASLIEDFRARIWLMANRPGAQLLVRVVLPKERDPKQLDQPLTTLLRGDAYQLVGRWEQLQLREPLKKLDEQKQLLRAELGRDLNFEGLFVDQIILNVLGGPGLNEVWIDDLEVSPVIVNLDDKSSALSTSLPRAPMSGGSNLPVAPTPRNAVIELSQDRLLVNKQPYLLRGARLANSSLRTLRNAGFNTLWLDSATDPRTLHDAVNLGFWLVPELSAVTSLPGKTSEFQAKTDLARQIREYPQAEAVLCWQVGADLTFEAADAVQDAVRAIRGADPYQGRPVSGALWNGFRPHGRNLDLLGVYRWPLYTGLELDAYWDWLESRGNLAGGDQYLWTWVQTHAPAWLHERMRDQAGPGAPAQKLADEPVLGASPEQMRLLTYLSLAAGCRGIGFWLDRPLTDDPHDRARFLSLALLNQELQLLEPMLATVKQWHWSTPNPGLPELRVASFRFDGGLLVIPLWLGKGSQFVPSQLAQYNLELTVPGAPQDAQAWEVTPTSVRVVPRERVAGGLRIKLPEFGLTTAVVFTADFALIGRLQQSVSQYARLAAQWSYELALEQTHKVEQVDKQLTELGHSQMNAGLLLADARKHLQLAHQAWERGGVTDYRVTYEEAQRALRPLRVLMRNHWQRAVGGLDYPTCSPFALCFETLPAHWRMVSEVRACQALPGILPHGSFEDPPAQSVPGWSLQESTLDGVRLLALRVGEDPKEGRQCLKLEIQAPEDRPAPAALEQTFVAIASPPVQLRPGTLVRISAWIKIPEPIGASADGLLFFDSCGGEPMAIRLTGKTPWRQFSLYRRVPASGEISVTMALTGLGVAYLDDVKIEPLVAPRPAPATTSVSRPAKVDFDP